MKKKKIITLILIIAWMIIVFCLSQQAADESSKLSGEILNTILRIFKLDKETSIFTENAIRKLAHFTLYTLGGILILSHVNLYNIETNRKVITSQVIGTAYAITDEFHQIFIPGRSGEVRDICIDSLGVITGIMILLLIIKLTKKKEGN